MNNEAPRIHISLDVADLAASRRFYQTLFGIEPAKTKPDYAKFEPTEPSVNLALNQVPGAATSDSRVSHFGIQVGSRDAVSAAAGRLAAAGLTTQKEDDVTCCYAVQDKVWVTDPDGNAWEIFVVTEADSAVHTDPATRTGGPDAACCPRPAGAPGAGCC